MGFWQRLRNWATGKGWKDDQELETKKEEQPIAVQQERPIEKPIQEREEIRPPAIIEERKEEEKKDDTEKFLLQQKTTEGLQPKAIKKREELLAKLPPEAEERKPAKYPSIKSKAPSIAQVNQQVNANLDRTRESSIIYASGNGEHFSTLKEAILNSHAVIDEQVADLIVQNAEQFKPRFNTTMEIYGINEQNQQAYAKIMFYGTLINNVENLNELEEGSDIGTSERLLDLVNNITQKSGALQGQITEQRGFESNVKLTQNPQFGVQFK